MENRVLSHRLSLVVWLIAGVGVVLPGCGTRREEPQRAPAPAPRVEKATPTAVAKETPEPARPVKLIRARVYEADDRVAVGARVTIESWRGVSGFWQGTTDRAGLAQVPVPEGVTAMRVSASLPGYAIVSLHTNVEPVPSTIECTLRLRDKGVTVVAELQGPQAQAITQCFARILPGGPLGWQHVGAAISSNCVGGRIVFPAIKAGLDNLRVSVEAAGFARTESTAFHTRAGDVTVQVTLVEGVALRGRAVFADGRPVPSFHLRAEPRLHGRERAGVGRLNQSITTDANGRFGPLYLLQDFYRLTLSCDDAPALFTNVFLDADETVMEFILEPYRMMNVRGTVLYNEPRAPAAGVTVLWETSAGQVTNVLTDAAGAFVIAVRARGEWPDGLLRIEHPGYAPIHCNGYQFRAERPRTFLLYATAVIHGATRCADGTPVSRAQVQASRTFSAIEISSTRGYTDDFDEHNPRAYLASQGATSDEHGTYVISNVAAPGAYTIVAHHEEYVVADPRRMPTVNVAPGGTYTQDIVLHPKPALYLRVLDASGTPVRTFRCSLQLVTRRGAISQSAQAQLASNEWHRITFMNQGESAATLELSVATTDHARGRTNLAWQIDQPPPYVVLVVSPAPAVEEPAGATGAFVCGFLYDHDRTPLEDVTVNATIAPGGAGGQAVYDNEATDPLGYFEMPSLVLASASVVRFVVQVSGQYYVTNLLCTGAPIEWVVPPRSYVRGRVCIASSATPATSFWVSIAGQRETRIAQAPDGRFAVVIPPYARTRETFVRARVEGLAPAEVPCDLARDGDIDVGDIIIRGAPAQVSGRVVNENGEPLSAFVTLGADGVIIKSMNVVQTKANDGTFAFTGLPPDTYRVVVLNIEEGAFSEAADSGLFTLQPGENKTLPDLVVSTTNTPLVRLLFVLPDGTPAARATAPFHPYVTDENGCLHTRIKCNTYTGVSVELDNERYEAEEFTITPHTRELTVRLQATPELSGTVTLDGAPFADGSLICVPEHGNPAQCTVRGGQFTLNARPGRYLVTSGDGTAIVTLQAGAGNLIPLTRGTATLRVRTPEQQTWYTQLLLRFGSGYAPLPRSAEQNVYTHLHPGEYRVRAIRVAGSSIMTNVDVHVTLSAGADTSVTVGSP